ncbi:TAT-variant-translocated molybdopterin oxidoreductase [Bacteroidia bacterium]|nr:TAT-variant-translocated molybdopterin oxidoreductase [Bacteroidia bacterium]MDB9881659.1 TAT-variant-translocated molybdopterin oxidoreductase [Bacteroidia bacterium]
MSSNKYWKGVEELEQTQEFVTSNANEFSEGLPLEKVFANDDSTRANRRDFLKYFGFGLGAVTLAACNKTPVRKAIPYTEKPDNVTPGVPLYYASSSVSNAEGFPVLVKVREGRPIKFEPNKEASYFGGGLDGLGHSAILSLYDTNRLKGAMVAGKRKTVAWADFDKEVVSALSNVSASGKSIAVIKSGNTSLVTNQAITDFGAKYANVEVISYEPISYSGITRANNTAFGSAVIPAYNFQNADVVVSFGADFLGTWISPIKFHSDYSKNRVPKDGKMSKHYQFESLMSLTGANADVRVPMKMSNVGQHLIALYRELGGATAETGMEVAGNNIRQAAAELKAAGSRSLVVCGSNNEEDQLLVNAINVMLGNYGTTIDTTNYYKGQSADEASFNAFVESAEAGKYGAVITIDANPSYSNIEAAAAFAKIPTRISTSITLDETSEAATHIATGLHPLESWDIKEPYKGRFVLSQPTISPVFEGRHSASSLLAWSGVDVSDKDELSYAYAYTKSVFENTVDGDFNKAVENGLVEKISAVSVPSLNVTTGGIISDITSRKKTESELILYQKVGVRDGAYGNTPWAHEMPDPVSKVTWDNYLSVSMPDAKSNGWENGDVMSVSTSTGNIEIPVLIQPGQTKGTYGIALGYGRILPENVTNDLKDLGKNAYPLVNNKEGFADYILNGVTIEKVEGARQYEFGITQTHYSIEGRDIIREASLDAFRQDPKAGQHVHKPKPISLWDDYDYSKGHHWGMAIDLNACTGCSACIVSCSIENNVPIVGREEVRRRREMHWLRIDRYYSFEAPTKQDLNLSIVHGGDQTVEAGENMSKEKVMEAYSVATDSHDYYQNVQVAHQPMMCQHCDNAPCETVCPVLATTHSSEGLNQMTYNRCIGTKYCGNNCPYKVRRFNWFRFNENEKFDYHFSNDLGKMVINPDVTVRSRGVMEKCSFCVQRIQSAKLTAKRDNRKMKADEFTTACAQTCPSNAIVFGDLNDANSEISKLYKNDRSYHVLEELGVKPSVQYLTKIRNKTETTNQIAH